MAAISSKIKLIIYFVIFVVVILFLTKSFIKDWPVGRLNPPQDKFCEKDADCACGTNINTGNCFYGRREFVDTSRQCPDFCTGIAANLEVRCLNNTCMHVRVR